MTTWAAFDVSDVTRCCHQIKQINDIQGCRNPKSQMMHPRPCAIGESHIMDVAFAVHPRGPEFFAVFVLGVFRHTEAEIGIEGDRGIHVVAKAIEMINPQRFDPPIKCVFLMDRL